MTETAARKEARDLNEIREPGDPIYTAYRSDPDGKVWSVGPVEVLDLTTAMPARSFEGMF